MVIMHIRKLVSSLLCLYGRAPLEVFVLLFLLGLFTVDNTVVVSSALLDDSLGFPRICWSVHDVLAVLLFCVWESLSIVVHSLVVLEPVVDLGFGRRESESLFEVC